MQKHYWRLIMVFSVLDKAVLIDRARSSYNDCQSYKYEGPTSEIHC
jgi:hypothetical protein